MTTTEPTLRDPAPSTERGHVTWLSSGEDAGPDMGIVIGLGGDRYLQVGEISRDLWEDAGSPCGDDCSWWLIQGPDHLPIARFCSGEDARDFADMVIGLLVIPTQGGLR